MTHGRYLVLSLLLCSGSFAAASGPELPGVQPPRPDAAPGPIPPAQSPIIPSVAPVSSLGNNNWDLAHDIVDPFSPTNGTPVPRNTDSTCQLLPAEATGVTGASSVGAFKDRYYNSNYGTGVADLTAPGGDRLFQLQDTPDRDGRVLSIDGLFSRPNAVSRVAA